MENDNNLNKLVDRAVEDISNDEEEKNILQNALKLGMQCLSEEEVSLNDY